MTERCTNEWAGPFFRYHYIKGTDAAGAGTETAASLRTTLREATRSVEDPSFSGIPPSRIEPEQSSLYRRHTRRFESWEPFFFFSSSFFIYFRLSLLPPTRFAAPLSFVKQLFSQLGVLLHDQRDNAPSASSRRGNGVTRKEKFAAAFNESVLFLLSAFFNRLFIYTLFWEIYQNETHLYLIPTRLMNLQYSTNLPLFLPQTKILSTILSFHSLSARWHNYRTVVNSPLKFDSFLRFEKNFIEQQSWILVVSLVPPCRDHGSLME